MIQNCSQNIFWSSTEELQSIYWAIWQVHFEKLRLLITRHKMRANLVKDMKDLEERNKFHFFFTILDNYCQYQTQLFCISNVKK